MIYASARVLFSFNGKPEATVIITKQTVACGLGYGERQRRKHRAARAAPLPMLAEGREPSGVLVSSVPLLAKIVMAVLFAVSTVSAQSQEPPVEIASPEQIDDYLKNYCVACHGPEQQKGDLRLDGLSRDFIQGRAASVWVEVMDRLNLGEMPPEDAKQQPTAAESAWITRWVAAKVAEAQSQANSTGGRVVMRRLNRAEYTNTIRDLLGVTFLEGDGPLKDLPSDGKVGGFDKVGKALLLDPSLMDAYFRMARLIADEAIQTAPPEFETRTYTIEPEASVPKGDYKVRAGENGVFRYHSPDIYFAPHLGLYPGSKLRIPVKGTYRFRFKLAGIPGEDGAPVEIQIVEKFAGNLLTTTVGGTVEKPEVHEVSVVLDPKMNREMPMLRFLNVVGYGGEVTQKHHVFLRLLEAGGNDPKTLLRLMARERAEAPNRFGVSPNVLNRDKHRTLYVESVEIEGPIYPNWPSRAMAQLFPNGIADGSDRAVALAQAREVFCRLLPLAYRRPIEQGEVDFILNMVQGEIDRGLPYAEALRIGLISMLCSPEFLLIVEPPTDVAAGRERSGIDSAEEPDGLRRSANDRKYEISHYQLASRLSYFLWSSMPDEKLFSLAASGEIAEPTVVRREVDRMLLDPKADAFAHNFAAQWFKTEEFARFAPDERLYRKVYSPKFKGLDNDLQRQPLAMFRELLTTDGNVLDIIDSDWTMVNERLAAIYAIPDVQGAEFQRVALPEGSHRGGLLGMAGVHRWGSDGVRTKPVERGKYILDVLFNDPPPPPPPNVGEVEPNIEGKNLTVRERLVQHQKIESCANCHRRIDPYGLAMENFNVIGEWRDKQDGEDTNWGAKAPPIDVSGVLPSGREFANFAEFKESLVEQKERYLRGLTEKMMTYALGRTLEASDRPAVESIVEQMKQNQFTIRTLVAGIVTSHPFRTK
ncbi:MAG: DUF1592 domain-containing protein [Planctomycetaceae bacterium]|nr:MAG: DUF1592 domain-containing protein [Planctomycetaceae bacterium]